MECVSFEEKQASSCSLSCTCPLGHECHRPILIDMPCTCAHAKYCSPFRFSGCSRPSPRPSCPLSHHGAAAPPRQQAGPCSARPVPRVPRAPWRWKGSGCTPAGLSAAAAGLSGHDAVGKWAPAGPRVPPGGTWERPVSTSFEVASHQPRRRSTLRPGARSPVPHVPRARRGAEGLELVQEAAGADPAWRWRRRWSTSSP